MVSKKSLCRAGVVAGALLLMAACVPAAQTPIAATARRGLPVGASATAEGPTVTAGVTPQPIRATVAPTALPTRLPTATPACGDVASHTRCPTDSAPWPTPAPTATPVTLPLPATALPSADAYRLKPWTEPNAAYTVALMQAFVDAHLGTQGYGAPGLYDTVALASQEALLRFPGWPGSADLKWDIARWLVKSNDSYGDTRATDWLAALIEGGLNDGSLMLAALPAQLAAHLNVDPLENALQAQVIPAPNLFGDGQTAYVLSLGDGNEGAALSIRRQAGGPFQVQTIANDWAMLGAAGFQVDVGDHNRGQPVPEITILRALQLGSGPEIGFSELRVIQWQAAHWSDLLEAPNPTGISINWASFDWRYAATGTGEPDQIIINAPLAPGLWPFCVWGTGYFFDWNGAGYELSHVGVAVPAAPAGPADLVCAEDAMAWAETEHTYTDMIPFLEGAQKSWPPPDQDSDFPMETVKQALGPADQDYYRLELGRFYALAGRIPDAQATLQTLADKPVAPAYPLWPRLARDYLTRLPDVAGAETALKAALRPYPNGKEPALGLGEEAGFEWSLHWQTKPGSYAEKVANRGDASDATLQAQSLAEDALFIHADATSALAVLSFAANPHWQCTDRYNLSNCGRIMYVLGLAYELQGDTAQAVQAYWHAWHDHPDSAYAVLARTKLVATP